MTTFGFLSYITTLITSSLIIFILKKETFLLAKPSIWFVCFFHAIIQWAATIYHEEIFLRLEKPYFFFLLTQIFPLVIILCSRFFLRTTAKKVWEKALRKPENPKKRGRKLLKLCFIYLFLMLCIIFIYLQYVPLTQTGLYVSFTSADPLIAIMAREFSAKLLQQQWLKYLYEFFSKFLAGTIVSTLVLYLSLRKNKLTITTRLIIIITIFVVVICAILPGARGPGVRILFVGLATYSIYNIKTLKIFRILISGILILFPAVFIQMVKYNKLGVNEFWFAFEEILLRRMLFVPMDVGIYWLSYVENHGYWGIIGIPKLASIFGLEQLNIANFLMNHYFPSTSTTSGFMTASFVFTYFSYFGLIAIPIIILCVLFLDTWVIFYQMLKNHLLLPTMITLNASSLTLLSSDYLTIFLTYGFFTGLVFISLVNQFYVKKTVS